MHSRALNAVIAPKPMLLNADATPEIQTAAITFTNPRTVVRRSQALGHAARHVSALYRGFPATSSARLKYASAFAASAALRHQFVTARFRDQDGRAGGVLLDLLPQPIDVRLEGVGGNAGVIAPDLLQQRLARDRTLVGTIEISQDGGLLIREPHLVALGIEQDLRARPERIGADGEHGVFARLVLA